MDDELEEIFKNLDANQIYDLNDILIYLTYEEIEINNSELKNYHEFQVLRQIQKKV